MYMLLLPVDITARYRRFFFFFFFFPPLSLGAHVKTAQQRILRDLQQYWQIWLCGHIASASSASFDRRIIRMKQPEATCAVGWAEDY